MRTGLVKVSRRVEVADETDEYSKNIGLRATSGVYRLHPMPMICVFGTECFALDRGTEFGTMNFSLLIQWMGLPLFLSLMVISIALSAAAGFLVSKRQDELLCVFVPLAFLPFLVSVIGCFLGVLSSVSIGLDGETNVGLVLLLHAGTLLFGCVMSVPPYAIATVGRCGLAWQASGLQLFPSPEVPDDETSKEQLLAEETEAYLERMVRPR